MEVCREKRTVTVESRIGCLLCPCPLRRVWDVTILFTYDSIVQYIGHPGELTLGRNGLDYIISALSTIKDYLSDLNLAMSLLAPCFKEDG